MLTGRHAIIAPRQLFSLFFLDWNQLDKLSARVLPAGGERVLALMLRRVAELRMEQGSTHLRFRCLAQAKASERCSSEAPLVSRRVS